jgi:hypothetical protein
VTPAQVSPVPWISFNVTAGDSEAFDVADMLRCLACGTVYRSRAGGCGDNLASSSREQRSGCPACGDVTWIAASLALPSEPEPPRSAADPLRFRIG